MIRRTRPHHNLAFGPLLNTRAGASRRQIRLAVPLPPGGVLVSCYARLQTVFATLLIDHPRLAGQDMKGQRQ